MTASPTLAARWDLPRGKASARRTVGFFAVYASAVDGYTIHSCALTLAASTTSMLYRDGLAYNDPHRSGGAPVRGGLARQASRSWPIRSASGSQHTRSRRPLCSRYRRPAPPPLAPLRTAVLM